MQVHTLVEASVKLALGMVVRLYPNVPVAHGKQCICLADLLEEVLVIEVSLPRGQDAPSANHRKKFFATIAAEKLYHTFSSGTQLGTQHDVH